MSNPTIVRRSMAGSLARSLTTSAVLSLALSGAMCVAAAAQQGTELFELRSAPETSLHYLLLDWALADAGEWPPYAMALAERGHWRVALGADEARTWAGAVEAYHAARDRSLLFDDGLLAVRDRLAGAGGRVPEADRALLDAVERALPVYRRHWWPAHDHWNRGWIRALTPTLRAIEADVAARLAAAYGGEWPAARIPVDVVPYANPVGAYSAAGRITVASLDAALRMPQAVEMMFHEASHIAGLIRPFRAELDRAFEAAGGEAPDRLWHDMIFYTSGEVVRLVLEARGQPAYRHYGEAAGVYARGERWAVQLPAFREHWRPFLVSGGGDPEARRRALGGVARALVASAGDA